MVTEWRSMEDAPKDGTHILLVIGGKIIEGCWEKNAYPKPNWEAVTLPQHGCGCCSGNNPEPSFWMPLIPLPGSIGNGN